MSKEIKQKEPYVYEGGLSETGGEETPLDTFRRLFYKKKNLMVYDDCLVYGKIAKGVGNEARIEAMKVIADNNLPLELLDDSNGFWDSITVQEKGVKANV
jgi:hypothetical protein